MPALVPSRPLGPRVAMALGLREDLAAVVVAALGADHVRRPQLLALRAGDQRGRLQRVVAAAGVAAGARRALLGDRVLRHLSRLSSAWPVRARRYSLLLRGAQVTTPVRGPSAPRPGP